MKGAGRLGFAVESVRAGGCTGGRGRPATESARRAESAAAWPRARISAASSCGVRTAVIGIGTLSAPAR